MCPIWHGLENLTIILENSQQEIVTTELLRPDTDSIVKNREVLTNSHDDNYEL